MTKKRLPWDPLYLIFFEIKAFLMKPCHYSPLCRKAKRGGKGKKLEEEREIEEPKDVNREYRI